MYYACVQYACTCKRVSQVRAVFNSLWLQLRTWNQWTVELRFRWCAFSVVYTCAFTVNCLLRFALSDICQWSKLRLFQAHTIIQRWISQKQYKIETHAVTVDHKQKITRALLNGVISNDLEWPWVIYQNFQRQECHAAFLRQLSFLFLPNVRHVERPASVLSSFITPEGSKISHKNTKIHKITHTKYDTKLHISTHIHTIKQ